MILLTFINSGTSGASIKEVIDKYFPDGKQLDMQRNSHFSQEMEDDYSNPDYVPTKQEIDELFTVPRTTHQKGRSSALGGGM